MLEDENICTRRREYADEHKKILNDILKQAPYIKSEKVVFMDEKIDFDDFSKLKMEHNEKLGQLSSQLNCITQKPAGCDLNNNLWPDMDFNIFRSYQNQDIKGIRDIISLFTPTSINPASANIDSLKINEALSLIVEYRI